LERPGATGRRQLTLTTHPRLAAWRVFSFLAPVSSPDSGDDSIADSPTTSSRAEMCQGQPFGSRSPNGSIRPPNGRSGDRPRRQIMPHCRHCPTFPNRRRDSTRPTLGRWLCCRTVVQFNVSPRHVATLASGSLRKNNEQCRQLYRGHSDRKRMPWISDCTTSMRS
jgi:hypothetical protein